MEKDLGFNIAVGEARQSLQEGGIPIGACLYKNGKILGRGHNMRVQKGSATLHVGSKYPKTQKKIQV